MLAVPPALLDVLRLRAGAAVGLTIDNGRLVVEPLAGPRFSLAELLAQCDAPAAPEASDTANEDRSWTTGPAAGRELI